MVDQLEFDNDNYEPVADEQDEEVSDLEEDETDSEEETESETDDDETDSESDESESSGDESEDVIRKLMKDELVAAKRKFESEDGKKQTFPFWRLPVLARSLVTKLMKPIDVILLTMTSTPFKRFIKGYKIARADMAFQFHDVRFLPRSSPIDGNNFGIDLRIPRSSPFTFVFPKTLKVFGKWRNVNGKPLQVQRYMDKAILFGGAQQMPKKMEYMEQMVKHLVDIFYVDDYFLSATLEQFNPFDCFVWDFVPKFHHIHFGCLMFSYDVTPEQLHFLMNSVKCDHMLLCISVKGQVRRIQLKSKSLDVSRFGDWVTMDHIIESECEKITGCIGEVKPAKTAIMVKDWLSGEKLTNLNTLELTLGSKGIDQSPALKTIDKFDGVQKLTKREERTLMKSEIGKRFSSGGLRKIRRATDGKIAILSVREKNVEMRVLENEDPLNQCLFF